MEEKNIPWSKLYLALMLSLALMIGLMYGLTVAYS
jgi:hypothetical protein